MWNGSGIAWIPALGILFPVFMLAVILGFIALMRYLRYRENLLMAQRGILPQVLSQDPPPLPMSPVSRQGLPQSRLRNGIVTSLVGLALLIGLWTLGTGPWLLGGLIPLAVGLGELLTFVILSPTREERVGGQSPNGARFLDENRFGDRPDDGRNDRP